MGPIKITDPIILEPTDREEATNSGSEEGLIEEDLLKVSEEEEAIMRVISLVISLVIKVASGDAASEDTNRNSMILNLAILNL